jgi:hypothetical protein
MHYLQHSALLNNGLGLFSFFGFLWLHHIPYLADVTKESKVFTVLQGKNDTGAVT